MRFAHAWVLLFAWLPLAWAAWEWRGSGRRTALALKAFSFFALLLALAAPSITIFESKVALAVLADTSASVTSRDLDAASTLAARLDAERGGNWMRVMPFGSVTRNVANEERTSHGVALRHTAGAAGRATNFESAIGDGAAALPAGFVPRLLLISDGNENLGSSARAIWQARQLGIPVDTVALPGRPKPGLTLESVTLPVEVFTGEKFSIELALDSPAAVEATVEISAEGKTLGSSTAALAPGRNHVRVQAAIHSTGAVGLAGRISASSLGETRFDTALALRRPRALLISRDPASAEQHLLHTLEANQFVVDHAPGGVPEKLDDYQLVIFNNWDLQAVTLQRKETIEAYVKRGGGLLWIAGEHNVYVDKKGDEDALERSLPAKLAPPRTPEGTCVVLIIDKSSSMEGKKIELARQAAIGVVENLRPIDMVGVLIFDNSFQWAVQIRKAEDRAAIKRFISGIMPDGGTQIAPALTEAYRRVLPQTAVYKHIVLLTDGISEEGDSMTLSKEAAANRVTISTVGLGQDVNRAFLEKVAQLANGKSYFLNDPTGLEQLLLRDVKEHTGSTAVEKNLQAKVIQPAEILDGVDIATAPPLRGYVRFTSRPTADTILEADQKDPLLVRWQYGLGRASVFTSDAKNRWAVNWITWPGFDRLWANIFRDLLPHTRASEATADFDRATNSLVIDYHLSRSVEEPARTPGLFAFGPGGFRAPLSVSKVAAGHYRARLAIGPHQGLFRIRPLAESRAFPEIGYYRQEDELLGYGSNTALLQQIAAATGGRFNPSPKQVFDAGGRSFPAIMRLWPGLLALALAANLLELVLRKWKGVRDGLRRRLGLEA